MKNKKKKKKSSKLFLVLLAIVILLVLGSNLSIVKGLFGLHDGQGQDSANDKVRTQELTAAKEQGLLILVNKQHPVNKEYKPDDLTAMKYFVSNRSAETRFMRAAAVTAFNQLVEKAAQDGIDLKMTTAYRSYGFQKILFDNYVSQSGEAAANRFSAKPGQSEHQTGLAVDVSSSAIDYQLTEDFGETAEGKWLAAHAHEFGFIIRYPKDKESITGYLYEPWHIRYVGKFAAKDIYDQNLTLEEYLQKYGF
jgi:zinc D-Ala-D-Ala carboxypeptidase